MNEFFQTYLERMGNLHHEIIKSLEGLPEEALDWSPGPEMNSICVLVVHLTGAERYWIGDVATGDPSNRDRDSEFKAHGYSRAALQQRLDETLQYTEKVFNKLFLKNLTVEKFSPRDGRNFSVGYALLHALEHTALHLGHIQLVRQLWDQQKRSG